jgi:hypothetical protein
MLPFGCEKAIVERKQSMTPAVEKALAEIRAKREQHLRLGGGFLGPKGSALYHLDTLALSVLDRSLALLRGFCDLVQTSNMIAAAPLLRCQLDNGLRFFASTLVENPHKFAVDVHKGPQ